MTDKDIETIITTAIHNSESVAVDWTGIRDEASGEIEDLEALRTHIAAMREIVQDVANLEPDMPAGDSFPSDAGYHVDQIIRKARALLEDG